jgi:hypothetical protein
MFEVNLEGKMSQGTQKTRYKVANHHIHYQQELRRIKALE